MDNDKPSNYQFTPPTLRPRPKRKTPTRKSPCKRRHTDKWFKRKSGPVSKKKPSGLPRRKRPHVDYPTIFSDQTSETTETDAGEIEFEYVAAKGTVLNEPTAAQKVYASNLQKFEMHVNAYKEFGMFPKHFIHSEENLSDHRAQMKKQIEDEQRRLGMVFDSIYPKRLNKSEMLLSEKFIEEVEATVYYATVPPPPAEPAPRVQVYEPEPPIVSEPDSTIVVFEEEFDYVDDLQEYEPTSPDYIAETDEVEQADKTFDSEDPQTCEVPARVLLHQSLMLRSDTSNTAPRPSTSTTGLWHVDDVLMSAMASASTDSSYHQQIASNVRNEPRPPRSRSRSPVTQDIEVEVENLNLRDQSDVLDRRKQCAVGVLLNSHEHNVTVHGKDFRVIF